MASYTQDGQQISVTTSLGKDVLLLESFSGVEAVSELFRFDLTVLTLLASNTATGIAFDSLLGQSVSVALQPPGLTVRNFNGIVSKITEGHRLLGATGSLFLRYQIEMVPSVWLLTRVKRSRIFQQQSVTDILTTVLGSNTFSNQIQGTFQPRDYCVQYRETDWDFACRLMEEEGIFYFFNHTASSHTLVMANSAQSNPTTPGPTSINFDEFARGSRDEERITSWVKTQEIRSGKTTLWDFCFEAPSNNYQSQQPITETIQIGTVTHKMKVAGNDSFEIYDYPGEFAQRFDGVSSSGGDQSSQLQQNINNDGTRTVDIRMEEEAAAGILIEGAGDCRLLTAGYTFTFAGHFNANGTYVVTRVEHNATVEGTYTSDEQVPITYSNSFRCIPSALTYAPPRRIHKPTIKGTQTAVVVGPSGQEINTDKYGRVKVQFAWDRDGKNDSNSSCWVRVGTPWAGQQWGMIHIPRMGQEVIVAFEEGDPDKPIIVGMVYNGTNMPPYTLPDNKTQSGILTRSSLSGDNTTFNQLRFEDNKGSEEVYFHAEKDFTRIVENNDVLQVGYQTKDGSHQGADGSQTIKIYKNRTETIDTGDETVTISTGSRTHNIKKDESLTIQGKQTINVTSDRTITVSQGKEAITIQQGDQNITVSQGNRSVTVSVGNDSTNVSAGASSTQAAQSITLKVGGNSIVIDQSGVTIKGIAVTIQGQATLDAKSPMTSVNGDGQLTLKGGITMIN